MQQNIDLKMFGLRKNRKNKVKLLLNFLDFYSIF